MRYAEAKQIIGKRKPDFSRTVEIVGNEKDNSKRTYNHVTYESYNLKRVKRNRDKQANLTN